MKTYSETLNFLYSQLPMYQRVGQVAFKKDLGNTKALLKSLGNPERTFPSIHIAGTNGKGSVAHMLAACYQVTGLRVGLYTSPHYRDFRERIKINGEYISKEQVVDSVERMRDVIEEVKPSFFELTVAMAFEHFGRDRVDLAVVETGLGGRLDSTNVITPLLSVITNIGLDHQQMLGSSFSEIAYEKAGIIKEGVPVVIGSWHTKTAPVFKKVASNKHAPLHFADRQVRVRLEKSLINKVCVHLTQGSEFLPHRICLDNGGPYQVKNLRTALASLLALKESSKLPQLQPADIQRGLENMQSLTRFLGRWQILGRSPLILADSAHNTDGIQMVLKELKSMSFRNMHFVLGFVNDKNVVSILKLFPENAFFYYARPDIPRGLDTGSLLKTARHVGRMGTAFSSVNDALNAAKTTADPEDLIYVGGSTFVVAEVV